MDAHAATDAFVLPHGVGQHAVDGEHSRPDTAAGEGGVQFRLHLQNRPLDVHQVLVEFLVRQRPPLLEASLLEVAQHHDDDAGVLDELKRTRVRHTRQVARLFARCRVSQHSFVAILLN